MEVAHEDGYKPLPEFQEDTKDPLVELNMTDSTELWLIQWPIGQPPDFPGQEVTLTLNQDRQLCSFEGPSGKLYKMVNFSAEEPEATVFHSTSSKSKIGFIGDVQLEGIHHSQLGPLIGFIVDVQQEGISHLKLQWGRSLKEIPHGRLPCGRNGHLLKATLERDQL